MKIVLPFLMSCILAFAATALTSLQAQDIFVPRQVKATPLGHVSRQQPQGTPQQENIPYDTPWKNWIAKGMFPYHRLVLADFPVNDRLFGEQYAMSTLSFSFPQFNYACVQTGS